MVLTPDDIKTITSEIASQIITELKRPVEQSFGQIKSEEMREATYREPSPSRLPRRVKGVRLSRNRLQGINRFEYLKVAG